MKIAVVGATGLVGTTILKILAERKFPFTELMVVASAKSVGNLMPFEGKKLSIISMDDAIARNPDIAIFSAGGSVSLLDAPRFSEIGTTVIDNSSAWRMDSTKKLIVPEVNAHTLTSDDKIIANPNCSTIQLVMVLHPLHLKFKINRIVVSTYQSVTGTGVKAVNQLMNERKGLKTEMAYPYQIDLNVIPQIDVFTENGYTKEEMKMVNETRKIMQDDSIMLTATTVRIPVIGGHSESVNIEFENEFEINKIVTILKNAPGIIVEDDIEHNIYPMPMNAHGKDEVFVGRIRRDYSRANCLNMWIVSDNLRKGAATNAVQIAEYLLANNLLSRN